MVLNSRIVDQRELRVHDLKTPSAPATPNERVRRFVALEKERRELEARLKMLEEETSVLKEEIADEYEESGRQRETVDGMTVYLQYTTYAGAKDGDMKRLVEALKRHGMGDIVVEKVDLNTLSSLVRERLKECAEQNIPDSLAFPAPVQDALHFSTRRYLKSKGSRAQ